MFWLCWRSWCNQFIRILPEIRSGSNYPAVSSLAAACEWITIHLFVSVLAGLSGLAFWVEWLMLGVAVGVVLAVWVISIAATMTASI